jgi:hypothetical protein
MWRQAVPAARSPAVFRLHQIGRSVSRSRFPEESSALTASDPPSATAIDDQAVIGGLAPAGGIYAQNISHTIEIIALLSEQTMNFIRIGWQLRCC